MASSTNPRVRRINQLLRIKNTEALPEGYHYGKGTYHNAGENRANWQQHDEDGNVHRTLTQWNYNRYPSEDFKNLPKEDLNGTNRFKVGNNCASQNLDFVDKTFQGKKADEFYQKQVRKHGMKPVSEIKSDTHGIRNHYPTFQNIIGHTYDNGPENLGIKYHPQNNFSTTYDLNHNHKFNKYDNSSLLESQHLPLNRKLPGERGASHEIRRNYLPAHVDEDFLPSWDLRQKDRPGSIGQYLLDQSQGNVKGYDDFKEVEQLRRAKSVHKDRFKTGIDAPEDALYTPTQANWYTSHGMQTKASRLLTQSKNFDTSNWQNRNFIRPRNANPLYKNVNTKINNSRPTYPEVTGKDRSHLWVDGVDRSQARGGSVQLRQSRDHGARAGRSGVEARNGSVKKDDQKEYLDPKKPNKEFGMELDQKQLGVLNRKVLQKSVLVGGERGGPQKEQMVEYGDY